MTMETAKSEVLATAEKGGDGGRGGTAKAARFLREQCADDGTLRAFCFLIIQKVCSNTGMTVYF